MPEFIAPDAGIIGLPEGLKEEGKRVDFKPDDFALLIETKGYRLAWSRTAQCPCVGINDQTDQSDPNCSLCEGAGWLRFQPIGAVTNSFIVGELDALQTKIVGTDSAVIRAIMTAFVTTPTPWDKVGPRLQGTVNVTTRAENKIGYYDRLVNLDSTIVYSELFKASGTSLDTTRYLVREINLLRSATQVYAEGTNFNIVAGDIQWVAGHEPEEDTQLVAHYLCHPTWRIIEHPHAIRLSPVKFKTAKPTTPQGDPKNLPNQGVAQYEWLPLP